MLVRQDHEAMIALELFGETQVTIAAEGSIARVAAMAAGCARAELDGSALAMVTRPRQSHDRRRV